MKTPDYAKYGRPWTQIPGSRFYRAYCPGCGDPVRVTFEKADKRISVWCEECSPPHAGCSSPSCAKTNGLDGDPDAWKPSWK